MGEDKQIEDPGWYSRPLSDNPKAILPLFWALTGAACWQAIPLVSTEQSSNSGLSFFWGAFALIGAALFLSGVVGSFVFRHYRIAAPALAVSLVGPPFWFFYLVGQAFGGGFMPLPCPLSVSEQLEMRPSLFWLCLQIPLALLALRGCHWPHRVKTGTAALALGSLVCFFAVVTAQARREVAATPRITDTALAAIYAGHDTVAQKRWAHRRIVLTGVIDSTGDGLIGNGSPNIMHGSIDCSIVSGEWTVTGGQTVTLLGTCWGKDSYGMIEVTDCRVVP